MEFVIAEDDTSRRSPASPSAIRAFFRRDELWYGEEAWLAAPDGTELAATCLAAAVTKPHDRGEFGLTLFEAGIRHDCPHGLAREEAEAELLRFASGDRSGLSQLQWNPPRPT